MVQQTQVRAKVSERMERRWPASPASSSPAISDWDDDERVGLTPKGMLAGGMVASEDSGRLTAAADD